MKNLSKIQALLSSLSVEELRTLNTNVIDQIKMARTQASLRVKHLISVGDIVSLNSPKNPQLQGRFFEVREINRTKAVIRDTDFGNGIKIYNAPLSMLILKNDLAELSR